MINTALNSRVNFGSGAVGFRVYQFNDSRNFIYTQQY